jgi:hypothetical protein
MRQALLTLVQENPVVERIETPYGTKYVVDGRVSGPIRAARVRTIWFVDPGSSSPRLVTVYPLK